MLAGAEALQRCAEQLARRYSSAEMRDAGVRLSRCAQLQLKVVQRSVELPSDQGWGSNELVRIRTDAATVVGSFEIYYAARVQRRFRRATNADGRVVEGLEIVKTYRVLDGVAGVEFPTSTTKSTIRLTRPKADS